MDSKKISPLSVLIVGCGNMGASHATSYHTLNGFEICGLVSTGKSKEILNEKLGGDYPLFNDYEEALNIIKLVAVCISTYLDAHESFAVRALESGCHVFVEKPLADSVEGAERVAESDQKAGKRLVIGYILRYYSSWKRFYSIEPRTG